MLKKPLSKKRVQHWPSTTLPVNSTYIVSGDIGKARVGNEIIGNTYYHNVYDLHKQKFNIQTNGEHKKCSRDFLKRKEKPRCHP